MKIKTTKGNGNVLIEENGIIKEFIPAERVLESIDNAIATNKRNGIMRFVFTFAAVVISFLIGYVVG